MASNKGRGKNYQWLKEHASFQSDECLKWPFSTNGTGYGNLSVNGKMTYAHRVMCEIVNGPAQTEYFEASHRCGNGRFGCVNPLHLSWKTRSENQKDRRAHGTAKTNSNGNRGKLTRVQMAEIASLKGKLTQREVAKIYGVHYETVSRLQRKPLPERKMSEPCTRDQVLAIREIGYSRTLSELAEIFGKEESQIDRIRRGVTYKDVG